MAASPVHTAAVAVALTVALAASACTPRIQRNDWVRKPTYYSVNRDGSRSPKYSRINELTRYGEHGLGAQAQIAAAYEDAQHAPPPDLDIVIFNAELPPGLALDGRTLRVDERAPYDVLGRYELGYWLEAAPHEPEIVDDLRRLAAVTGADALVVEVDHIAHADPRVHHVTGFVLRKRAVAAAAPPPDAMPAVRSPAQPPERVRRTARLDYVANGPGCFTADELADEVSARLGYVPWDASAATTLRVQIGRREDRFEATLRLDEQASPRRLTDASCRGLTEALISVVVTQLDLIGAPPVRYD